MLIRQARMWAGFAGLCVLSGSGWLVDEWHPGVLPGLLQMCVHQAGMAVMFWVASVVGKAAPVTWKDGVRVAGWGAALLAVPAIVVADASGRVSGMSEVLMFGLVPALVVFALAQVPVGSGGGDRGLGLMGPALAGLAGAALLIPFTAPASTAGWWWLGALAAAAGLAGFAAIRLHVLLQGLPLLRAAAGMCAASALLAGALCRVGWSGIGSWDGASLAVEIGRWALLDGPIMLLTVWLLQSMRPVGFSARYLLTPLVTIVEGLVLLRPGVTWTMLAGFALLAGGGLWLLRADPEESQTML